ncbi:MAG: hypothetical protein GX366_06030 [Epulopiscium sp.]|nr:hypothetical protein [Candidatus Epulonipiscium sp.]
MLENQKDNLIFGLDIGTRTIIGIVGYKLENEFVLVASEVIEHESRAMVDGQIHDILAVARSAKKVKESLEAKIGSQLKEVSIAAAGRVLKTVKVNVSQEFNEVETINNFMIKGLELQGIHEAKKQISNDDSEGGENGYLYVGHSVINYYLNKYAIANLEEQRGQEIGADILATFLPKVVVESLYTVMDKIGLKVINITLEPIAAMNAVIPSNLRLLNLALVDIGAGTSDIAITQKGSVTAYGMIPLAGDEITEKIIHTYLVDFDTGENIKQQLSNETIEFIDIIGISHEIESKHIHKVIRKNVEQIGEEIANKIIDLNGGNSPNAVFCVGGASQTPYITEILADRLALPIERVSIRSSQHATMVIDDKKEIEGPESITPLGICLTTIAKKENDYMNIMVNGKMVELLHTKNLTVEDAVIAIGLDHKEIISVRGKTLMFKLNGERVRIKGEPGVQPRILLNNESASLESLISEGDELEIHPAQNGQDGQADMLSLIARCGLEKDQANIIANNKLVDISYIIKNGDEITIESNIKKEEVKEEAKKEPEKKEIHILVNGDVVSIPQDPEPVVITIFDHIDFDLSTPKGNIVIKHNGQRAVYTDILKDGDRVEVYWD